MRAPAAAGIGTNNSGNMLGKRAWPGVPAGPRVDTHDRLGYLLDSRRHPKLMKINEISLISIGFHWFSLIFIDFHWFSLIFIGFD